MVYKRVYKNANLITPGTGVLVVGRGHFGNLVNDFWGRGSCPRNDYTGHSLKLLNFSLILFMEKIEYKLMLISEAFIRMVNSIHPLVCQ